MSDNRQSLADLAALTGAATPEPTPAAPAAPAKADAAPDHAEEAPAPDANGVSTQGPQIEAVLREQQLDK